MTAADDLAVPPGATPVLLDDIVSSGRTMVEALRLVAQQTPVLPVVVAVHAVLAEGMEAIAATGAQLVTTSTIAGAIDVAPLLAPAVSSMAR